MTPTTHDSKVNTTALTALTVRLPVELADALKNYAFVTWVVKSTSGADNRHRGEDVTDPRSRQWQLLRLADPVAAETSATRKVKIEKLRKVSVFPSMSVPGAENHIKPVTPDPSHIPQSGGTAKCHI